MESHAEFEQIYRSNIKLVRKIISSHSITNGTADDIAQSTFLAVFEKLGTVKDRKKINSWIATIARNFCLIHYRSSRFVALDLDSANNQDNSLEFQLGLWMDPESQEVDLEIEQNLELLNYVLSKYSKEPRGTIARLFYLEGYTTKEISARLDNPQNTVLSHLMLFRREMKSALLRLQKQSQSTRSRSKR